MPLVTLLGLSAALHLYIGVRILPAVGSPAAGFAFAAVLAASALLVPASMLARRLLRPQR